MVDNTLDEHISSIQIHDLAFGYKGPLFERFNAQISAPGVYGLFGRNGTGKSTLLKLLSGLLTPSSGEISVRGFTPRRRAAEFLSQIYLLPEEFHLPDLKPEALKRNQGVFYPNFDAQLFQDYLTELQVPSDQRFSQMSLGQKKKATIAFALATLTPVLLMDEPTNGLDIVSRAQFKRLMQRPEQAKRTVLISTHQAHDLESILTHLWFIDQGRIVLDASMQRVAERVRMGVAASADALPDASELLYQTPVGAQWAWVARIDDAAAPTGAAERAAVQLELLYKALSLAPEAVLAALQDPAEVAA